MTGRIPPVGPPATAERVEGGAPDADAPVSHPPAGRWAGGVLVVGYGNPLRSDDGVGPAVAGSLARDPRLAGATILARHQLVPELADEMRSASLVVLVDATVDAPPGTIVARRVDAPAAAGADPGATSHHVDPAVLLALARDLYGADPVVHVVSVGAADLGVGEGLTPPVAAAVPGAADAVAALVEGREDPPPG